MFKVVPDQLRISEGWVRCGHCAEVFDASAHLQQDAPGGGDTPLAPPAGAAEVETGARVPGRAEADVHAAADSTLESSAFQSSLNTHLDDGAVDDAPDTAQLEDEARALIETPLDQPFELRRQDSGAVESRPARFEPLPEEPELHDLSFVRKARRQEFWRRPGGCAGNIAYNLKLLGGPAAADGHGRPGLRAVPRGWMARVRRNYSARSTSDFTAQAFITTDLDDNQITAFHPGAMTLAHEQVDESRTSRSASCRPTAATA